MRLGNGLVHLLVFTYSTKEILFGRFWRDVFVVWVTGADLKRNVGCYDRGIVADGLQEDQGNTLLLCDPLLYTSPVLR